MMNDRNLNLDLLRLLGVLIIMVAHASPPAWLSQLRNFGTPLLVVASALTYSLIYAAKELHPLEFYKKRLARLILPAWIFLSAFFLAFLVVSRGLDKDFPFSIRQVVMSYGFLEGIKFLWIFKVYILLALVTPVALALNRRISSDFTYFTVLILAYLTYEVMVSLISPAVHGGAALLFDEVIFIVVPYAILYLYGFRLSALSRLQVLCLSFVSFALFACLAISKQIESGYFVPTQDYKYPPTVYYFSYAFCALNLVYLACRELRIIRPRCASIIRWLSSNSLWVYLWHIMGFYVWKFTIGYSDGDFLIFVIKAIYLFAFGVVVTLIQKKFVSRFISQESAWGRRMTLLLT